MNDPQQVYSITPKELKECLRSIPADIFYEPSLTESFPIGQWMHLSAGYIEALEHQLALHQGVLRISCRPIRMPPKP